MLLTPRAQAAAVSCDRWERSSLAGGQFETSEILEKKAELRRAESAEVIAQMKTWLGSQASLKTLSIGKAAAYVVANWERLTRFLEDARIPRDNNATERGIRGPVVGRRNHFGSKSQRGTEIAAIFCTLLETAKLHGIDPARYLREAAIAASRGVTLLPQASPETRPEHPARDMSLDRSGCLLTARGAARHDFVFVT